MEIKLRKLALQNFKGIRELEIEFSEQTNIFGDNGTGKTTIFDAYTWLLFDKDSSNNTKFNIKTLDKDGQAINNLEHTVEAILEVDNAEIKLAKSYKEVWTKKRGSTTSVFDGHTTDYYVNDVPLKLKDYKSRIDSIIDEETFKLISNPRYFSVDLDKNKRRQILMGISDPIPDEEIFKVNPELSELPLDKYTVEEILATNKATAKKANEEIKEIPIRIDEVYKNIKDIDFKRLEAEKRDISKNIELVDKQILEADRTEELKNLSQEMLELQTRQMSIKTEIDNRNSSSEREYENQKREMEENIKRRDQYIKNYEREIENLETKKSNIQKSIDELLENHKETSALKFNYDEAICSFCGHKLEGEKLEEEQEKFNIKKSNKLEEIVNKGKSLREEFAETEIEIEKLKIELEKQRTKIFEVLEEFIPECYPIEIEELQTQIDSIREKMNSLNVNDNSRLLERKRDYQKDLEHIDSQLVYKESNQENKQKIENYKLQLKQQAGIHEEAQRMITLVEEYNKIKAELISLDISNKFQLVDWKLFEEQINGGIAEVCEATVNGVPYSDVNNANKINAGLDIINALSRHYGVTAPVFVDNAESVNTLIDTDSQVVRLVVSKDKELVIN